MDHLPSPIDNPPDPVGLFAEDRPYEPDDFFNMPTTFEGTFDTFLENGFNEKLGLPAKMRFLQEWLFFALLAHFLGRTVHVKDYRTSNRSHLNTKRLNVDLQNWMTEQKEQLDKGITAAQKKQTLSAGWALTVARRYIETHCSVLGLGSDVPIPLDRLPSNARTGLISELDLLHLSLAILGETLHRTRARLDVPEQLRNSFWVKPTDEDLCWGYSQQTRRTLLAQKLSPEEIHHRESIFGGVLAMHWFSTMDQAVKDSTAKLEPHHIKHHCLKKRKGDICEEVDVPLAKLAAITEANKVPLVTFVDGQLIPQGLDLRTDNVVFGALSHRWGDEIIIRNEQRESNIKKVFCCQLQELQQTFNEIAQKAGDHKDTSTTAPNVPFWVDAICTPKMTEDKQAAFISATKTIYEKASTVLVWDRGLLKTTLPPDPIITNMLIRASPWARRIWTLLELMVSKNIVVAFKNRTRINFSELEEAGKRAKDDTRHNMHLLWRLGRPFSPAIVELRSSPHNDRTLALLWSAVQFREVTEAADETIVLANVLNLHVAKLLRINNDQHKREKRMVQFLKMLDKEPGLGIPPGIIFLSGDSLRINRKVKETRGYGWAPMSWLGRRAPGEGNPLQFTIHNSFVGRNGLFVTYPGVMLHCSGKPSEEKKFWVPTSPDLVQWYEVTIDPTQERPNPFVEGTQLQSLCLILSTDTIQDRAVVCLLARPKGKLGRGKAIWATVLCRVWVRLETNLDKIGNMTTRLRTDGDTMYTGERVTEQLWCVDGDGDCDE